MLKNLINQAIKASTVNAGVQVDNTTWRDLAKKSFHLANEQGEDGVADLLYAISKLKGDGFSLMANANSLLRVAKALLL